jgi:hypothetical protein
MPTWKETPLFRSPVSIAGAIFTTISALLFLIVFLADLFGLHTNPYVGILFFLVMPGFFVFGLALIPVGMWLERRREQRGVAPWSPRWPRVDLNDPHQRTTFALVAVGTMANIVIVSLAAYRGIEYMDSVPFCGQVCHVVMQPEFTAYQDGPHSRVTCVGCHIGSGAPWFVRSKLSGTRQVFAVTFNTFSRPIPSPVQNLRPARETCEECHWPEKFHGDKVVTVREYADDQANTETKTTLHVHIGGVSPKLGRATGIHWHVSQDNQIDYKATDDKRQTIPWVRLRDKNGQERIYRVNGVGDDKLAPIAPRRMDCVDCHNRPSHPFAPAAARAVDVALALGEIDTALPFARREAVASLAASYPSQDAAASAIDTRLRTFYRTQFPQAPQASVEQAIRSTQRIYRRNIFPSMKIGWATYPVNIGHTFFAGCFRCHDDNHKSADGRTISQDCELCHTMQ